MKNTPSISGSLNFANLARNSNEQPQKSKLNSKSKQSSNPKGRSSSKSKKSEAHKFNKKSVERSSNTQDENSLSKPAFGFKYSESLANSDTIHTQITK